MNIERFFNQFSIAYGKDDINFLPDEDGVYKLNIDDSIDVEIFIFNNRLIFKTFLEDSEFFDNKKGLLVNLCEMFFGYIYHQQDQLLFIEDKLYLSLVTQEEYPDVLIKQLTKHINCAGELKSFLDNNTHSSMYQTNVVSSNVFFG